jgi:hypothetical protein
MGKVLSAQLRDSKGVRIEKFGTFACDARGTPAFLLDDTFAVANRVRQTRPPNLSESHALMMVVVCRP